LAAWRTQSSFKVLGRPLKLSPDAFTEEAKKRDASIVLYLVQRTKMATADCSILVPRFPSTCVIFICPIVAFKNWTEVYKRPKMGGWQIGCGKRQDAKVALLQQFVVMPSIFCAPGTRSERCSPTPSQPRHHRHGFILAAETMIVGALRPCPSFPSERQSNNQFAQSTAT
jgi:hypothetical protein